MENQRSARELLEELANYVPSFDPNESGAPFDPYQTGDTQ